MPNYRPELIATIKRLNLDSVPYNTNNAWGYGGSHGKEYKVRGDAVIRLGTASTRGGFTGPVTIFEHEGTRHIDDEAVSKALAYLTLAYLDIL